ncbi:metal ABC transporter substrate-binding protein [Baekduia sp.]|uniref:metal ABC transporter substrate-binding protein n=1 Tax=Baekduia sp. TaxID=2600305 RepID=UPI002D781E04|nr:metal ABC transporter substrate-binding protein [Baekduia sp.]
MTVVAAAAALAGCGSSSSAKPGTITVVATTTQLGDVVREIGGSAVDVHQILQPNTDPHDYEPRPRDIQRTADAKLVVTSGDGLDHWIGEVVKNAGGSPTVLDAGQGRPITRPGEDGEGTDPHWWHDPRNIEYAIGRIRDALAKADPGKTAEIDRNATTYLSEVKAMDAGIAKCFARVPVAERKLVTDHDAFGYFAARYGIDVVGAVIPSQTTQAQPSAGDLARLVATIRREHVRAIFPETSINPKLAQAIARETGATADHELYGDTLGPAGSAGDTYIKMEQANANAMVEGFTGGRQRCAPAAS